MKKIIFFMVPLFYFMSCGTKKIMKKEVKTSYTNISFNPLFDEKEISNSLSLTIEPIDAKELNEEVFETFMRDGGYEQHYKNTDLLYEGKEDLSRAEIRLLEKFTKVTDFINELSDKKQINQYVYSAFLEKTYNSYLLDKQHGFDGSEVYFSTGEYFISELNPYKVNNKHLSLFRFTFKNKSDKIENIEIEDFQVSDNNESLYPFKIEYFESIWENSSEKIKYIYRMNMPNKLTITPQQRVVKYISTPVINPERDMITVSYINDNKVINYPFEVKVNKIDERIIFNNYRLFSKKHYPSVAFLIHIVDFGNKNVFPLKDENLYIQADKIDNYITIHTLSIPHKGNKFKYFVNEVKPSSLKVKSNIINFD